MQGFTYMGRLFAVSTSKSPTEAAATPVVGDETAVPWWRAGEQLELPLDEAAA